MEMLNGCTGVTVITLEASLLMGCLWQLLAVVLVPLMTTILSVSTFLLYEILLRKRWMLFVVYLQMMILQVSTILYRQLNVQGSVHLSVY